MRVEQLMSKDVASCDAEDRLNDVAAILWERDCGSVPVVARSADGRVVAMITDRDICMAAYTTSAAMWAVLRTGTAVWGSTRGVKVSEPSALLTTTPRALA